MPVRGLKYLLKHCSSWKMQKLKGVFNLKLLCKRNDGAYGWNILWKHE